ncbi:MAG TPA: cell envelope integrity protein CreD [Paludibacter sp.]|nr:cell envelope integrity protein CreD [Paludibacter sp.]
METNMQKVEKFSQSITLKAIIIGFMTLLMLIPGSMIQSLISERHNRSAETIEKINAKWSNSQTVNGPVLVIPYFTTTVDDKKNEVIESHTFILTPELLNIKGKLIPEERHYGIYKSILYKSELEISGNFKMPDMTLPANSQIKWNEATVRIGISDLRGMTNNLDFQLNGFHATAEAGGASDAIGQGLVISLKNADLLQTAKVLNFKCNLKLNGSSNINFIPIGKTTHVQMNGAWKSPGFIGSFTPEYTLNDTGFNAHWNILHFNRNIPESWSDKDVKSVSDTSFGVNLVDEVDHYQQNMRSAKYALMFIALTFVVFFFVEVLTRKKIHPIQYLLVGIALILFYSLLLSISEQINFGVAYLIASIATIGLIVIYAHSIFKDKLQTGILGVILSVLYIFLYVVLQLEDIALLIGSIGLFIILAVIMFVSRKISWYKNNEEVEELKAE